MPRNVLIVEDAEICSDTLEVALMKVPNLAVRSVGTAEEALQWLAANDVSALVTDLHLPSMDGFALIEAVRSRRSSHSHPGDQRRQRSAHSGARRGTGRERVFHQAVFAR